MSDKILIKDVVQLDKTASVRITAPTAGSHGRFSFALDILLQSDRKVEKLELFWKNYLHESLVPANTITEGGSSRFHFFAEISTTGLPEEFVLIASVVYAGSPRQNLLRITGTRQRLTLSAAPAFKAIGLNGIPRSGTTLAMGLLSSHARLVTKNQYPFEHRPALYWVHLFQTMSRPNNVPGGMRNWDFEIDRWKTGAFTYYSDVAEIRDWVQDEYIEKLGRFCVDSIDDVYALLKNAQQKPAATSFVEKFPGWKGRYFAELYPSYTEVVVVRDIRDVFLSVQGFNKRRGQKDFGVDNFKTEGEYMVYLGNLLSQMASKKAEADNRTHIHIVRYEDIMRDPIEAFGKLFAEMGLEADAQSTAALEAALKSPELNKLEHRTGSVSDGGIGRWKKELDSTLTKEVAERSGTLLASLGYEV